MRNLPTTPRKRRKPLRDSILIPDMARCRGWRGGKDGLMPLNWVWSPTPKSWSSWTKGNFVSGAEIVTILRILRAHTTTTVWLDRDRHLHQIDRIFIISKKTSKISATFHGNIGLCEDEIHDIFCDMKSLKLPILIKQFINFHYFGVLGFWGDRKSVV